MTMRGKWEQDFLRARQMLEKDPSLSSTVAVNKGISQAIFLKAKRQMKAEGVVFPPVKQVQRDKKIKAVKKPFLSLAEVNALARKSGMSYGEYVAKMGV